MDIHNYIMQLRIKLPILYTICLFVTSTKLGSLYVLGIFALFLRCLSISLTGTFASTCSPLHLKSVWLQHCQPHQRAFELSSDVYWLVGTLRDGFGLIWNRRHICHKFLALLLSALSFKVCNSNWYILNLHMRS